MTAAGGLGKEAWAAVHHPGDGLGLGEPGARFQTADVVYNTRRHSQYLVILISAVAVAFWNSSYRSATHTDKVERWVMSPHASGFR